MALLLVINLINFIRLTDPFERHRSIDTYIKYNVSSDLSILFLTIDHLDEHLISDDQYKIMSTDELAENIDEAYQYTLKIASSLEKAKYLNQNFDLEIWDYLDFLSNLEDKLSDGEPFTESDIDALKTLIELRRTYSNAAIPALYEDDTSLFEKMALPEKTRLLIDGINQLAVE
ncbi:MAG: hypothetical protein PWP51_2857 [Clostridiales bacterium]|nr:hypothetical protein [Clostridiales bacterium]